MASAIAIAAAPATPCTKRSTISAATEGAMPQSSDVSTKEATPMSRGRRRPRASLMGPAITWPRARPRIQTLKVICVCDIVALRSWLTAGREGKYIMNFSQLQSFVALAETGSFTEAAYNVDLTQSAVSHALAALESELGVTLLERNRTGVVAVTNVGQKIIPHVRAILAQAEAIEQEARGA